MAGDDPDRVAAVLKGVRAYQRAQRLPGRLAAPVAARIGRVALHDYGGDGRPVVFVPSLINSADILDLDADRSMLRWLAARGIRPLLLDWGEPASAEGDLSIAGHVSEYLAPLIAQLDVPPVLVGYCLGGTMTIAAAAIAPVAGLVTIAAPWHFAGYPDSTRGLMLRLWEQAKGPAAAVGLMPMEVLQSAFWQIDPQRTMDKFAAFGRVADSTRAVAKFVAVEDWANDGPPLTFAAARELFDTMLRDDGPGSGQWSAGGCTIDPAALAVPMLEIVSSSDRIVPAATTPRAGRVLETGLGHVGMIVSASARETIWQPLLDWLLAI